MEANDQLEVCAGCNNRVERDWHYCPACGRTRRKAFVDGGGMLVQTRRKDLSVQALSAAFVGAFSGVFLLVGAVVAVLVKWTGLLEFAGEFLVFPLGFVFGASFGLVGFSLWLKFEGHKYGSRQP